MKGPTQRSSEPGWRTDKALFLQEKSEKQR
jgi:hypothetical protein